MKSTIFTILLLAAIVTQAQVSWTMVYHNDSEGKRENGNIGDLIEAIRNGKEIRMAWWAQSPSNPKRKVEHLADASFLTIMSDSIVFGQIEPIYGQTPDFNDFTVTLKENLEWVMIGGTNGNSDAMTSNTITGEILGHSKRKRAFKWYVKN